MRLALFACATGALLLVPGCLTADVAAPGTTASLDTPPALQVGDWWRLRVVDDFLDGTEYEVTRVVAAVEEDHYLVGAPADSFDRDILMIHLPGLGEVGRDLSFDMHDKTFQPIRFPVTEGDEWTTSFDDFENVSAVVMEVTPTTAEIQYTAFFMSSVAVYDLETREFVRMEFPGYATVEVLDHGRGYEGDVLVPAGQDIAFFEWRSLGAFGSSADPAPPQDVIQVPERYD